MMPLTILYEDNHLLAVDKPAGLLTQPTADVSDSLETRSKTWLKEKYAKPGNVFLVPIHRLDKPVSGIVLFAKTSKALSRLNEAMREQQMVKTYVALVHGAPSSHEGTLEHYLRHDDHKAEVCEKNDRTAKLARLRYKTLERHANTAVLEISLDTGRYHQIRCQCAAAGFPIVNDMRYGGSRDGRFASEAIALHHAQMSFTHPITGQEVIITSPRPFSSA